MVEEEIFIPQTFSGRRPSSAGPRTKYNHEEVSFQKSNSFNQGPYKPFIRRRKDSSGSRPSSIRSDPDRNSIRKSGLGTPPEKTKRKTSKVFEGNVFSHDRTSNRDSNSPRDSGVVMSSSSPPFQRNALRSSFESRETKCKTHGEVADQTTKDSPLQSPSSSKQRIIRRSHSRDRDSRDSAYDSGMQGMFNNRKSGTTSIHVEGMDDPFFSSFAVADFEHHVSSTETGSTCSPNSSPVFLTDVLEAPSLLRRPQIHRSEREKFHYQWHFHQTSIMFGRQIKRQV